MTTLDNSIVFKHVLDALIDISSRKTTLGHAVSTMNNIIKQLEDKYDFLKHVEVNDTRFIEQDESVSVMRDLNNIKSNRLGDALYDIIRTMNIALGKDAGYFFIKELKNNLQDNYITSFEDMGLDLGLMQLEHEIKELTKKMQK